MSLGPTAAPKDGSPATETDSCWGPAASHPTGSRTRSASKVNWIAIFFIVLFFLGVTDCNKLLSRFVMKPCYVSYPIAKNKEALWEHGAAPSPSAAAV